MAAAVADAIGNDGAKIAFTGLTYGTGGAAATQELARSRALADRDALKAAGVAEADIEMKGPIFVEAGASGCDAEARRVEIMLQ